MLRSSILSVQGIHCNTLGCFNSCLPFCSSARLSPLRTTFSKLSVLKKLFWAVVLSSVLESLISIAQYFSQGAVGLTSLGELKEIGIFKFYMPEGKRWLLDNLLGISHGKNHLIRASGTFTNPNILGGYMFFSLLASFSLFCTEQKKWIKMFLQLTIFLQTMTLILTFSRAAILATLFSSLLWFGLVICFHRSSEKTFSLRLALTFVSSLALCFILFFSQLEHRGGIINYNSFVESSDKGRIAYQQAAWEIAKEHPLLGVGYNNFQLHVKEHTPSNYSKILYSKVHNIYLLVLAEMGICGLIAFLLFLYSILRSTLRSSWNMASITLLSMFAGFLLIGGCDFYFIETSFGKILFFGVAGCSM